MHSKPAKLFPRLPDLKRETNKSGGLGCAIPVWPARRVAETAFKVRVKNDTWIGGGADTGGLRPTLGPAPATAGGSPQGAAARPGAERFLARRILLRGAQVQGRGDPDVEQLKGVRSLRLTLQAEGEAGLSQQLINGRHGGAHGSAVITCRQQTIRLISVPSPPPRLDPRPGSRDQEFKGSGWPDAKPGSLHAPSKAFRRCQLHQRLRVGPYLGWRGKGTLLLEQP